MIWQCNIDKIAIFSKLNYRFKAILLKMPDEFFAKIETLIKKLLIEMQGTQTSQKIIKKKVLEYSYIFLISKLNIKIHSLR